MTPGCAAEPPYTHQYAFVLALRYGMMSSHRYSDGQTNVSAILKPENYCPIQDSALVLNLSVKT